MSTEKHYTDKEFCGIFQIDRATSSRWRKAGIIRYLKTPTGQLRYLQSHIEEFDTRGEDLAKRARRR